MLAENGKAGWSGGSGQGSLAVDAGHRPAGSEGSEGCSPRTGGLAGPGGRARDRWLRTRVTDPLGAREARLLTEDGKAGWTGGSGQGSLAADAGYRPAGSKGSEGCSPRTARLAGLGGRARCRSPSTRVTDPLGAGEARVLAEDGRAGWTRGWGEVSLGVDAGHRPAESEGSEGCSLRTGRLAGVGSGARCRWLSTRVRDPLRARGTSVP